MHTPGRGEAGTARALARVLGPLDVVSLVVGTVIGSGIFIVPAAIARAVEAPGLILAVWVVGGLLTLFGALALSELSAAYPTAGGIYVYLKEAYGPMMAFLFGWSSFVVIEAGGAATLAVAFSTKYLPYFVDVSPIGAKAVAVALLLALMAANIAGVRWGAAIQAVMTVCKVGALVAIVVAVFGVAGGNPSNFTSPPAPPFSWAIAGQFGLALVSALWAYKGWELVTFAAGEVREPGRNLPLGLLWGTLLVIALYLCANLAFLYVAPAASIAASTRIAADAMSAAIGPVGAAIVAAAILLSIAGAANGVILAPSRLYYAMAADGLFFQRFAAIHPRLLTPHVSLVATAAWSIVLALSGTFEQLLAYVVFVQWIFLGLAGAAVIVLRRRRPDLPRPYRTWGYPVTPILFVAASVFIAVTSILLNTWNAAAGLGLVLLGVPAYFYWRRG
jgi:APA family basic amino acid/polyamine antiporter